MESKQILIGTVPKNNRGDEFRVQVCVTSKSSSIDVREYYISDSGEILPTKKGIRVNDEKITELMGYIFRACSLEARIDILDTLNSISKELDKQTANDIEIDAQGA